MDKKFEKSLEQLEKKKFEKPNFGSRLSSECLQLWSVPIKDLSIDNLRLLIGQQIGLNYLIPFAMELLSVNPLEEGSYFKGDLLQSVISIQDEFWSDNPELFNQMVEIKNELEVIEENIKRELKPKLKKFRFK